MKSEPVDLAQVMDSLGELRQEVGRLRERVAALETSAAARPVTNSAPQPFAAEVLSEETVVVIGAAIAAFLGKKPQIREIRLQGGTSWAQLGRAAIQASHALTVRRD